MPGLAALVGLLLAAFAGAAPAPRTIVLVSVDTLRADRVREDLTPRLSRFARGAAVFESATAQATWTLPSHASMLTSLLPSSHGAGGTGGGPGAAAWRAIAADAVSAASALRARGWRTEALVSSPVLDPRWGFSRGFDDYRGGSTGRDGEPLVFDDAARSLERAGEKPLFLFVHTNIVHGYARQKAPPAEGEAFRCPITGDDLLPGTAQLPLPESPDSPRCAADRRAYDRAAACMDRALGVLLDALERSPRGRDALVIVTSDHGEVLCESHPGTPLRGHGFAGYAEQLEIPLIVRLPGGKASGLRVAQLAREIDIPATILDAAGVPAPKAFQGRSLLPLLEGKSLPPVLSLAEGDDWKSAREGDWEYLRRDGGAEELYDLSRGRPERDDLAAKGAGPAARLRRAVDALPRRAPTRAPAVDARLEEALKAEGYRR
jgi:arylsulfatase A-like enzyme